MGRNGKERKGKIRAEVEGEKSYKVIVEEKHANKELREKQRRELRRRRRRKKTH